MQLKLEKEWEPTGLGPQPQGSSQPFSKRKTFILKENGSLFPVSVAIFSFIRARRGIVCSEVWHFHTNYGWLLPAYALRFFGWAILITYFSLSLCLWLVPYSLDHTLSPQCLHVQNGQQVDVMWLVVTYLQNVNTGYTADVLLQHHHFWWLAKTHRLPTVMQKVLYCYFSVCKDCLIKFCRSFSVSVIDAVRPQAKQLCFEKFSISPAPGCLKVFVKK